MIEESKLIKDLLAAGFDTGWVVRGEKIVLWTNDESVPAAFADFVQLDETE
jgi:hypothetical protein